MVRHRDEPLGANTAGTAIGVDVGDELTASAIGVGPLDVTFAGGRTRPRPSHLVLINAPRRSEVR
ncbi:hypothetical protein ACPEEZ_13100 [Frigoribacterium sp. 2-23]|uniref:hypothetical protein n=1 Tax=Frigoribacterium sp. 2-23 TaxID=3415006 RepID=UPI003C6EE5D7